MLRGEAEVFCARLAELYRASGAPSGADTWIAPPYSAIETTRRALDHHGLRSVLVGAQNCHWLEKGAHTGELSPAMLTELGCAFAILGHSERRQFYGETDSGVCKRARAAISHGFRAIVCVGETEAQYRAKETLLVVESQLAGSLADLSADHTTRLVVAYEPVWAIGTGLAATPEIAREVHRTIRSWLETRFDTAAGRAIPILYGGSTTPDNIYELCSQENINGALVGGASLKPESFSQLRELGARALAA